MEMVSGAKAKRTKTTALLEEKEDEEQDEGRISLLPEGVLGDIVSFLPTKDGARTQLLSSRWRHLWRTSPLHLRLENGIIPAGDISRVLAAHPGPGRRFSVPQDYFDYRDRPDATTVDSWFQSPALVGLQELEFHHASHPYAPPPSLPASVHRFSSTLRVASFGGFGFPDGAGDGGGATGLLQSLHLPVLEQLSLMDVRISESSLRALLAACPVLQSLLLDGRIGCSRVEIASSTLRSIGMSSGIGLQQHVIQDAPCLERLLLDSYSSREIRVSVISAPKLYALGPLSVDCGIRLEFGSTNFQTVVHSVKVLALIQAHLSLDAVIESMKRFPCLEKLYIKTKMKGEKNIWCRNREYKDLISSLDIRLKKIVVTEYRGNTSHVNFAKFFVLNARMLQYMRLEIYSRDPSSAWVDKQHKRLRIENKASKDMQLDFASNYRSCFLICHEKVHDLSTTDPF